MLYDWTLEIIDILKLNSGRYGDLAIAHMLIGMWFEHFHAVLSLSSRNVSTINTSCVEVEDVNESTSIEHPFSKWKSIIFCLELLNILGMCVVMFCGLTLELNRFNCYRYTTFLPKHRSFVSLLPLQRRLAFRLGVFFLSLSVFIVGNHASVRIATVFNNISRLTVGRAFYQMPIFISSVFGARIWWFCLHCEFVNCLNGWLIDGKRYVNLHWSYFIHPLQFQIVTIHIHNEKHTWHLVRWKIPISEFSIGFPLKTTSFGWFSYSLTPSIESIELSEQQPQQHWRFEMNARWWRSVAISSEMNANRSSSEYQYR